MQAYMRLMTRRPLLGPCITTAFLFGTGDIVAQQLVDRKGLKDHDWIRTGRLSLYGGTIFAPIVVNWYKLLDRMPIKSKPALVASRVVLDQFAFAPIAVGLFFTCTGLMEGKTVEQVKTKLEASYKETLIANWTLFIPFQTINMAVSRRDKLYAVSNYALVHSAAPSFAGS
ncbi:hypothetical protein OPQ81_003661 [Rhizoctonia solani]|nr:hypothetical protein OPQ81_003661 [Rhizoctonia solani]